MKIYILSIVIFIISLSAYEQFNVIKTTKIGVEELPDSIKIEGKLIEALTWNDNNGKNYFISYQIGPTRKRFEDHEDEVTKQIFAKQYILNNDKIAILWHFNLKRTCVMSLELLFIPNSVNITDLDSNGVTETTFVYKTANRSDVSSADIELIMHENKNKYALKGKTFISYSKIEQDTDLSNYEFNSENTPGQKPPNDFSGRFLNDDDFEKTPNQFLRFAIEIWRKHIVEYS